MKDGGLWQESEWPAASYARAAAAFGRAGRRPAVPASEHTQHGMARLQNEKHTLHFGLSGWSSRRLTNIGG